MAGISSPGIGSGLDINGIISKLMEVERQPLAKLDKKEAGYQAEISGYGSIKSALSQLRSSLDALKKADTFQATKGTSSDEKVVSLSTQAGVVPSSYQITVNRLAQRHKTGSLEFASTQTFGGSAGDSLTITSGTKSFTVDLSTAKTLQEIQAAINVATNDTGITAGLISGNNGKQVLVLSSAKTGYADRVQLAYGGTLTASTFGFSTLNRDASGALLTSDTQLDASLTVDGVSVTRGSNSISDVIDKVTLELKGAGTATATVAKDPSVATDAVRSFVKAYNGLKDTLSSLSNNTLSGNSLVRGVETRMRAIFNTAIGGLGSYRYLSEMGITTNRDTGKLELDSAKLEKALQDNGTSVLNFFSDANKGFAKAVDNLVEGYIGTGGIIDSVIDGVNSDIQRVNNRREEMQRRLDEVEKRYRTQFTALDSLVAQMNTTSDYLGRQLDALANMIQKK